MKFLILYFLLFIPQFLFAQGSGTGATGGSGTGATGGSSTGAGDGGTGSINSVSITNPLKADSITAFFLDLIQVILVFATPIIVFFIILAGFKYVMARGNPEKISEASRALLFAIIGGVLILGAFVILQVIQGTIEAITL